MEVRVGQISFGSLFQILFIPSFAFIVLWGVLAGVLAFSGMDTVSWNGTYIHGMSGFVVGLLISGILGFIVTGIGSVFSALLLKVFGRILPVGPITIRSE